MDDKALIAKAGDLLIRQRDSLLIEADKRTTSKEISDWLAQAGCEEPNYWQTGSDVKIDVKPTNPWVTQTRTCERCGSWQMQMENGVWFHPVCAEPLSYDDLRSVIFAYAKRTTRFRIWNRDFATIVIDALVIAGLLKAKTK